ncbi:MAG: Baseplate J-like protein [Firmicutes bacterium ADurb.Bin193]|nr:MAG: Baseplate J-like protein [Firmicutes bacterium ADurb.Bin193]
MIGEHLDKYTFEYILKSALANVSDEIDKREGSIIYDAIAPACLELSQMYKELKAVYQNTFASTAKAEYLDARVAEQGVTRKQATYAVRKGRFYTNNDAPFDVALGSRFATANGNNSISFTVSKKIETGIYELTADVPGTVGNEFIGDLLPITNINNLKRATINEILIEGETAQTDDQLRAEYFEFLKKKPFGGNIAQYRSEIRAIKAVINGATNSIGAVQVYPTWNGGGTVKCNIITSAYRAAEPAFINAVQQLVDPEPGSGLGLAPIGHKVTIGTATEVIINVSATITTASGILPEQIKPFIEAEIERYFEQTRQAWGTASTDNTYSLYVFIAQVTACILRVNGVLNVSNLTLNNQNEDIVLTENSALSELPVLGVVTLD